MLLPQDFGNEPNLTCQQLTSEDVEHLVNTYRMSIRITKLVNDVP